MKNVKKIIIFVTIYMVIYNALPYTNVPELVILSMFILSPVLVGYMVFVILKYGKPSSHQFDARFYDDFDYQRNKAD